MEELRTPTEQQSAQDLLNQQLHDVSLSTTKDSFSQTVIENRAQVFTSSVVGQNKGVVLTDAATIAVDLSKGNYFKVTLTDNRTLGNPTGARDGERIVFEIIQDGTGGRTLAFDTKYAFGFTLDSITLSTGANKRDFIGCIYNATTDKFYVVAFQDGF